MDIGAFELLVTSAPPSLANATKLGNGEFQFGFNSTSGASFTVLTATNLWLPLSNWTVLGPATEISPGQFQFTDVQATNISRRFYCVRSP